MKCKPCKCGKPWSEDAFHKGQSWCKDCMKAYYQSNKPKFNKNKSNWLKSNPEKRKARQRRKNHLRRAKVQGSQGGYTLSEAIELYKRQNGKCASCRATLTRRPGQNQRNLDHVQPLGLGGSNGIENLQWLCSKCNNEKGAMDPYEWARLHGKLFA